MVAGTRIRLHREPGPVHSGTMPKLHVNSQRKQEQRPRFVVWVSSAHLQGTRVFHMADRYPPKPSLSLRPGTQAWEAKSKHMAGSRCYSVQLAFALYICLHRHHWLPNGQIDTALRLSDATHNPLRHRIMTALTNDYFKRTTLGTTQVRGGTVSRLLVRHACRTFSKIETQAIFWRRTQEIHPCAALAQNVPYVPASSSPHSVFIVSSRHFCFCGAHMNTASSRHP